jgi:hypothetical protein
LEWERKYAKTPGRRRYVKAYYERTKAAQHAKRSARRAADPAAEYRSLRRRRPWKTIENAKRSNAKKRNIPYALTAKWFELNYQRGCAITGLAFCPGHGVIGPLSATVDRIDPSKGYTPRNCRLVLHAVNAMRGSGDDELMMRIARAIVSRKRLQSTKRRPHEQHETRR